jgi:hypothetical protein
MPHMPEYDQEREDTPDPEEYLPWDLDNLLPPENPDGFCEALVLTLACMIVGLWIQGLVA